MRRVLVLLTRVFRRGVEIWSGLVGRGEYLGAHGGNVVGVRVLGVERFGKVGW